jgi:hypothetical protein
LERLNCEFKILRESEGPDKLIYRKVRFIRNEEEAVAISLPGPKARPDVFLLTLFPVTRARRKVSSNTWWLDVDAAIKGLGANCVHRPAWCNDPK